MSSAGAYAAVSYHIPLHSRLEEDIQALQGMGYLNEVIAGSRPWSRLEAAKAVINIIKERGLAGGNNDLPPLASLLLKRIEMGLKEEIEMIQGTTPPQVELQQVNIQAVNLDGTFTNGGLNELQSIKYHLGRVYKEGLNIYGGISLLGRYRDATLLYLEPEFQYARWDITGTDELRRLRLRQGYLKFHTEYSDIMFGNVPLWWGQGYNGTLLLTDNIEPLTMLRLYKEDPFILSLPFNRQLILTYDFFITRLDADRELPRPVFWGLRIGFKPVPSWEIGIARTAMLGGGDRPVNLKTFAKSFTGSGENTPSEAGNQIGGFDTNFTGHLRQQHFKIYAELYGEDEAGLFPSRYAYLAGFHLPDIAGLTGNSLRAEYASTTGWPRKRQGVWYTHHIYTDGYTYRGRIMGHGMGPDADDFFIQLENYFSENVKGNLSFERNRIGLFNPVKSELRNYSAGINLTLRHSTELTATYTFQEADNLDFSSDRDFQNNEIWLQIVFGSP